MRGADAGSHCAMRCGILTADGGDGGVGGRHGGEGQAAMGPMQPSQQPVPSSYTTMPGQRCLCIDVIFDSSVSCLCGPDMSCFEPSWQMVIRACYAMRCTELTYGPTNVLQNALYGAAYIATKHVVLSWRMVLPGPEPPPLRGARYRTPDPPGHEYCLPPRSPVLTVCIILRRTMHDAQY
eukprot:1020820-Rhodomonas_salina.2